MNNLHTHSLYSLNNAEVRQMHAFFGLTEDVINDFPPHPFKLSSDSRPDAGPFCIDR